MGILQRFQKNNSIATYQLTSGSGGGSGAAPACSGISVSGFKTSGSVGSLTPSSYKGYTITEIANETDFVYDGGFDICVINEINFIFSVSSYTGTQTGLFNSIKVNNNTYNATGASSYAGGIWTWVSLGIISSGTVIIS